VSVGGWGVISRRVTSTATFIYLRFALEYTDSTFAIAHGGLVLFFCETIAAYFATLLFVH
jgi:hypothetical protein